MDDNPQINDYNDHAHIPETSYGEIYSDGKLVSHFEYDHTSGWACERMYPDRDGVAANWYVWNYSGCNCGQPPTRVVLYAFDRRRFHWDGKACFGCITITGGRNHHEPRVYGEGRPTSSGVEGLAAEMRHEMRLG